MVEIFSNGHPAFPMPVEKKRLPIYRIVKVEG
jgi:hypothetical protein